MDRLRNVLARLATRKSRARKKARRGHVNHRFRFQRFEPLEERQMLSGTTLDQPAASDYPLAQTFFLHSQPTSTKKIYLDLDGSITSGTVWNTNYNVTNIVTPAYSLDEDAAFSDAELQDIQDIWQRVAEDFLPFDVDVTTEDPGTEALQNLPLGLDNAWGLRIAIGGTDAWMGGQSSGSFGYAYSGCFNWPSDTPQFVFSAEFGGGDKYTADIASWAVGFGMGLRNDGTSTGGGYEGHGSGDTSWAPIMGFPVFCSLTQWSKGEYPGANNTEDDLARITGGYSNSYGTNGISYRTDLVGDTRAASTAITMADRMTGSASGIIERNTDVDMYRFTTGPGDITLTINPAEVGANLDILATLYDSSGNVLETSNPVDYLNAGFTRHVTIDKAGTYYVSIQGTGKEAIEGDPGYTNYGSLGYYSITANLQPVYQVLVDPTTGLQTTEAGGTATFAMKLSAAPSSTVTVPLASSDLTEGTISVPNAIFTTGNWDHWQTFTVTGVDDLIADKDENVAYTITTGACQSNDANYRGYNFPDVAVTNVNDDTAGFIITPLTGLVTSESGAKAAFTVTASCQPTAAVTLALSTSNANEGTVSVSSLTFNSTNWNVPQTVTVTGVDDGNVDGPKLYSIITAKPVSTDTAFNALTAADVPDVAVTNLDNEVGYVVSPTSGLVTNESGTTVTFTVMPSVQPTASVTVTLLPGNTAEGRLSTSTLLFTETDWSTPQTVTVTGVDDDVFDGSITYAITGAGVSADPRLNLTLPSVTVTNNDNDTAGFTILPVDGLQTSEQAERAYFTVQLTSRPSAPVTLNLSSNDVSEGTLIGSSLVFAPAEWNVAKTVTVAGVNDDLDDGNVDYKIFTAAASSADTHFNGVNPTDVSLTNIDDDTAGVIVSRTDGLLTAEYGTTDTFTVRLATRPATLNSSVTISLSSDDATEGTVSPTVLIFTTSNWNTPQTVTVHGVDDTIVDVPPNNVYHIVTAKPVSTDATYNALTADMVPDVTVTNLDDDVAGLKFTPTGSLATSESGGAVTFTVQLMTTPTAPVTVGLVSSNTGEGTLSVASLVFPAADWNVPQTVTLTGVDDNVVDGNTVYSVQSTVTSSDAVYAAVTPANLSITNVDNDTAAVVVTPVSGLVTTEAGGKATFSVALNHQPLSPVNVYLYSSNTAEGTLTQQINSITRSGATATVTCAGHGLLAGDLVVIHGANQSEYNGQFTITAATDNTFTYAVSGTPASPATGTLTAVVSALTFSGTSWSTPRTVTVTGIDDLMDDGDVGYSIVVAPTGSADPRWNAVDGSDVSVTNTDNDTAGVVVSPTSLEVTENSATATFSLVLNTQPVGNYVSIGLTSDDPGEGTVSLASVSFNKNNWNVPQTVTVTGQHDWIIDGDQTFHIITGAALSDADDYRNRAVTDVTVLSIDTDTAQVVITPTSGLTTTEAGGTATFTVKLSSQPKSSQSDPTVSFTLSVNDTTEATLDKAIRSIVRSGTTATVTAPAHGLASGSTVLIRGADQADYNGLFTITNVTANTFDYAVADTAASPATGSMTAMAVKTVTRITRTGTGSNAVATVTCATAPGLSVGDLVTISGADQDAYNGVFRVATVTTATNSFTYKINGTPSSPATGTIFAAKTGLTFTTGNWNVPQTVTVTGLDDEYQDGDVAYQITTGTCVTNTTSDVYSNLAVDDVSLTNLDDDRIEIRRAPASGLVTSEAGAAATFEVWLGSKPSANVSVHFASSDASEGQVLTTDLVWTPADWQTHRTVIVVGLNDLIDDGNVPYTVKAVATSADISYNGLTMADVQVVNNDDADTAGISVSAPSATLTHEWGSTVTFTVVLASQPVDSVVVPLSSSKPQEGLPSPTSLIFTAANWNVPQTVTVTGQDDHTPDGLADYQILVGPAQSSEAVYQDLRGTPVSLQNKNDTPVASDNSYTTAVDTVLTVADPGVIANDSDDGSQAQLSVIAVSEPAYGTLVLNPTGGFSYTPQAHFAGVDQFIYQLIDGQGASAQATVTITVGTGVGLIGIDVPNRLWETQVGFGTVSRLSSASTDNDLIVYLTTPDGSQISLPEQVVIPAHEVSVSFPITALDDSLYNGTRSVEIWAGAPDYWSNHKSMEVGDNDLHHFSFALVEGTKTAGVGFSSTVWARDINDETIENYTGACLLSAANSAGAVSVSAGLVAPLKQQITSITRSGTTATVMCSNHGLTSGALVLISGADQAEYNGQFVVTSVTPNTFNYTVWGSPDTPATGSMLATPLGGKYIFNATVNAVASGVYLVASDGLSHTGSSNTFNVAYGTLDHFTWTSDPLPNQQVGTPFVATVTACDNHGYQVASFTGTASLTGWVSTGASSSIVISEISDKNGYDLATKAIPDYIELENVGTDSVSTWNWKLLANNPDAGLSVYQTCSLTSVLAMSAGDTAMFSDNTADADLNDDDYYFGSAFHWGQGTGKGWVMLVDQNNALVDFLAWGYSESELKTLIVTVGGNNLKPTDSNWFGDGVTYDRTMGRSLQRRGSHDRDVAGDFAWATVAVARPSQNSGLSSPFGSVLNPIDVSPATVTLAGGVWSGSVTVNEQVQNMFLEIEGQGLTADSHTFSVGVSQASSLASTPALVDPASAVFYIKHTNSGGYADAAYGYGAPNSGWIPLAGDWDGDGMTTVGMYDPSSSCFYLTNASGGGMAQITFGFGQANAGWLPVVGDWNGDNVDTVGLYDPQSSCFLLSNKNQSGFADLAFGYGSPGAGWTPIAGDFDGDGIDGVGLYATSSSTFYLRDSTTTGMANYTVAFGQGGAGWKPILGDWNADGQDTIAVYDPASGTFYERDSNTSGYAEHTFGFGETNRGWLPLAGDWNGANALNAVALGSATDATSLNTANVAAVFQAALNEWNAVGLEPSLLRGLANVEIVVADLPGTTLGLVDGNRLYLDNTAAGYGWFVDPTPTENEEFSTDGQLRAIDPAAVDRVDLLSVVAHELGHVAGLEHVGTGLMSATLDAGLRRVAGLAERDALFAAGAIDDHD
jgi:hypothetical protein